MVRPCSRAEYIADAVVHLIGLAFGVGACATLAIFAVIQPEWSRLVSLSVYGLGLLAMLACSALYNMTHHIAWKARFRRLDHAAIFVMIAGSYTPLALAVIGGSWGYGLLVFVWTVALTGVFLKLCFPLRFDGLSVVAYLLLGWTIVIAIGPLLDGASTAGLILLATGGGLYSLGVIFHLWERLPFQAAIWHVFVLAAAACHFSAILVDVAI